MCVNKSSNAYTAKRWNLYLCTPEQALPPMEEYKTDQIDDPKIVLPSTELLRFRHTPIPSNENNSRRPMENYNDYFDNYLETFVLHNTYKEKWLWNAFLSIYQPDLIALGLAIKRSISMYGSYATPEIMENQKNILEENHPGIWKYWQLWRRHMLDFRGIPGEFVFTSYFTGVLDL